LKNKIPNIRVAVFRTNIGAERKTGSVLKFLQLVFPDFRINFNMEDCEKILRVENQDGKIDAVRIISLSWAMGKKLRSCRAFHRPIP